MMTTQGYKEKLQRGLIVLFFIRIISLIAIYGKLGLGGFFNQLVYSVFALLILFAFIYFAFGNSNPLNGLFSFRNYLYNDGGTTVLEDELYDKIANQYRKIAHQHIEKKEYAQAARVYLKLLDDPYEAAAVYEKGEMHKEAAAIYEFKIKDLGKAAEQYEKAFMYAKAIQLYEKIGNLEKVADLYQAQQQPDKALHYYNMVIHKLEQEQHYLKAAIICAKKVKDIPRSQSLTWMGWNQQRDAVNCISYYFELETSTEGLLTKIEAITSTASPTQKIQLIKPLKKLFKERTSVKDAIGAKAVAMISEITSYNNNILFELPYFLPENELLSSDVNRYTAQHTSKNRFK